MNVPARYIAVALLTTAAVLTAARARGQTTSWNVTSGTWSTGGNWTSGVPTGGTIAYITNGGTADITATGGTCSQLLLGNGAGNANSGTVVMTAGSLAVGSYEAVGQSGIGAFTQSGGTNSVGVYLFVANNAGGSGTFTLNGSGLLTAANESVGQTGIGVFTQLGGINTLSATGSLLIGNNSTGNGTYNLNGGLLVVGSAGITQGAGSAAFNFGGGTLGASAAWSSSLAMTLTGSGGNSTINTTGGNISLYGGLNGPGGLQKAGSGMLTLSASNGFTGTTLVSNGLLLLANTNALSGSTFDSSGAGSLSFGTLTNATFGGLQGSGSFALNDTSASFVALTVGANNASTTFSGGLTGTGDLTKIGTGILTISGSNTLNLAAGGFGPGYGLTVDGGTLALSSGSISSLGQTVGYSGGCLTQSGGTNAVGFLFLGAGSGTYNLTGSGLLTSYAEAIGYTSTGIFTQSGGTHSVTGNGELGLVLGYLYNSAGIYTFDGGLLLVGSEGITQGFGSAAFNFGGGTLRASSAWSSSLPMTLTGSGGNSTIDTTGGNISLSGGLSGPGGLNKVGPGILAISGVNTYAGSTTASGGTLELLSSNASSSFTAKSGAVLLFSGATFNVDFGYVQAASGGSVQYQNATLNGGFLRGPGPHATLPGSSNIFSGTTTYASTIFLQNGADTFRDFSNGGQVTNNAPLTWDGGSNNVGGNVIVNSTISTDDFTSLGVITINRGGAIDNSLSEMTFGGGSQTYVNAGGTLNADSQNEGVTLDLQDSLLVNAGTITGTTNVNYGATVSGSGSFGPIIVNFGGTLLISPSYGPVAPAAVVSGGSVTGAGASAFPITTDGAYLVAANATDRLTFTGDLGGSGSITKLGAGTVVLSGTDTYQGGTIILEGALIASNNEAIKDGTNLYVGTDLSAFGSMVPAQASSAAAAPAVAPVPEPRTLALLAAGVLAMCHCGQQRRRQRGSPRSSGENRTPFQLPFMP